MSPGCGRLNKQKEKNRSEDPSGCCKNSVHSLSMYSESIPCVFDCIAGCLHVLLRAVWPVRLRGQIVFSPFLRPSTRHVLRSFAPNQTERRAAGTPRPHSIHATYS